MQSRLEGATQGPDSPLGELASCLPSSQSQAGTHVFNGGDMAALFRKVLSMHGLSSHLARGQNLKELCPTTITFVCNFK